ncbi:MAG: xanthine dehydrogenase [Henriciella sp.]|uniref:xanthine dehydrogenase family protein molybdopterin-binding subunit n=1 Tax=Henriciella sp. TaxID=1968823 RepID=UPI000C10EAB7|nr:xanthine dehydrogenase family protein molybdopterin-binding subunit [Henriciella sp.]MAN73584.1 xanthine dehydrogenase [Henriciella sp.]MBF34753.1 xanthine dehydrogenase [Hyphomonadaceae bacterium]MBK74259.1 xanthine dehydrogenase [Henriciella sp.]PHR75459.1 MAG: xanthine dehydrogenase [Henriciella sp.]
MTRHLKMDEPATNRLLDKLPSRLTGAPMDRPDGPLKVSGTATYAHEWQLDGKVFGVLARAPVSKGKLVRIDKSAIENLPGVLGVFSEERFLRNPAQGMANEAPEQGVSEISYFGQPIALVVAETFEQARHGAHRLELVCEAASDGVFDPEANNIAPEKPEDDQLDQGDLDKAMAEAAYTVDSTYRTPSHNSAAMEPHCAIASWEGDQLTLYASYQMIKFNVNELADSVGIEPEKVRIVSPYVGGGFGSKLGIAPEAVSAAIAAKELGRPVCVTLTRQQVFENVMRRSESRQRLRLAADKDGKLTGLGHECRVSNLPGESFHEPVLQATHFIYGGDNRRLGMEVARLNRMCAGSVRAPGEAIGMQVLENAMDELAHTSGIDPVELRKRNIPDAHPEEGTPYSSRPFAEALDEGAKRFGWNKRNPKPGQQREGEWLIGMGMAAAARVNILMESKARVILKEDGKAIVETDMTDIGTGTYAILTQVCADMLGLEPENIETRLGDSNFPKASGSGGSFGAASSGSSVYLACLDIRAELARRLGCEESELQLDSGQARGGSKSGSLTGLLAGEAIEAEGHIEPGETKEKVKQATYGSYFAEVAVNAVTGETRVRRMLGVFGAGRILNRKTATSQCYGGMTWGIGMALHEAMEFDMRDGHVVNNDLAEYHIPVNLDVPQLDVVLLEERDDWASPIQAKGLGELGLCGAGAAITNAIFNATGVRVYDYPATLDKILDGLPELDMV